MTVQYRQPIRANTPQKLVYQFQDQNQSVIDLTKYISCTVEVKVQGVIYAAAPAVIFSASNGMVEYDSWTFSILGVWTIQFVCQDGAGNRLFGEPLQITVTANVEDLTLPQLANY